VHQVAVGTFDRLIANPARRRAASLARGVTWGSRLMYEPTVPGSPRLSSCRDRHRTAKIRNPAGEATYRNSFVTDLPVGRDPHSQNPKMRIAAAAAPTCQ
jgi:hypothetical protein